MLSGRIYTPREYIEQQLNMSEEEKKARGVFFDEMFTKHNAEKAGAK